MSDGSQLGSITVVSAMPAVVFLVDVVRGTVEASAIGFITTPVRFMKRSDHPIDESLKEQSFMNIPKLPCFAIGLLARGG